MYLLVVYFKFFIFQMHVIWADILSYYEENIEIPNNLEIEVEK